MKTSSSITHSSPNPFAKSLPPGAVKLAGWLGHRYELTWRHNLLALNWDEDFLRPFQEQNRNAGFYVGFGKTFEGLSRFAFHTQDPELLKLRRHVLDTLLPSQSDDGYLGTYLPEFRISRLWDVHELAYLTFGLIADSELFGEAASLDAAKRIGNHLLARLDGQPLPTEFHKPTQADLALELSLLGLDRAFLALHSATGDTRYLKFCIDRLGLDSWDLPIVEGRHGRIEGQAYAYLCHCLAQLDLWQISGNEDLLDQSHRAVNFLTARRGLLVDGAFSMSECWHSDQNGAGELGETCSTAYWIRLCARLLCVEGNGRYGDLMERSIYNALFAAQSPDGRRLRYYVPLEGPRVYWDRDTYCCPGNYRRILSELPGLVYFTTAKGVLVNLYSASTCRVQLASDNAFELIQTTDYPNNGSVTLQLSLEKSAVFTITLRIPGWCKDFSITAAGQAVNQPVENGLVHIERKWESGDCIDLEMEIPWRLLKGEALQAERAALLRGPVLFCVNPKAQDSASGFENFELALPEVDLPKLDNTLRPHGMSCLCGKGESLIFTEFADPDGQATYFRPSDEARPTGDELLLPPKIPTQQN